MASAALVMSALFQPWAGLPSALAAGNPAASPSADEGSAPAELFSSASEAAKLLANPGLAISQAVANMQNWETAGTDAGNTTPRESGGQVTSGEGRPAQPQPTATPVPSPQPTTGQAVPRVAPDSRGGNRPTPDLSTPEKFIGAVVPCAQDSQLETGVPASVTIAQAILESAWGKSGLSQKAQNYFGIKATSGPGPAGVVTMDTWEVFGGLSTVIRDGFKAYHNLYESVIDHGRFLAQNPRYAVAFDTDDPKEFARRIHASGYATDPDYCTKLSSLIDRYRLDQYDVKGSSASRRPSSSRLRMP